MLGGPSLRLDPRRCALLVIDMQNDFVSPGGFHHRRDKAVDAVQAIVPRIRMLLTELPPEVRRVFVATSREPDGSDSHWRRHRILPEGRHARRAEGAGAELNAVRGTWGAEIVEPLRPGPEDPLVFKRRYSAFHQTDLELRLRCWGVDTLFFTGVATEVCVETTLRAAFVRDFDVVLVSDGAATWDAAAHEATCNVVRQSLGAVLTADEVTGISWLRGGSDG